MIEQKQNEVEADRLVVSATHGLIWVYDALECAFVVNISGANRIQFSEMSSAMRKEIEEEA